IRDDTICLPSLTNKRQGAARPMPQAVPIVRQTAKFSTSDPTPGAIGDDEPDLGVSVESPEERSNIDFVHVEREPRHERRVERSPHLGALAGGSLGLMTTDAAERIASPW